MNWTSRVPAPAVAAVGLTLLAMASVTPSSAQCDRIRECELVWADEFDGTEVDESKWEVQTGTGTDYGLPSGWGNSELQYYQPANATVADGRLTITAKRESVSGSQYTSARLRTLGKAQWTYGRMEMRAKMPIGQGLWPAFWMLASDDRYGTWAASGEIDIVEYLGNEPERIFGTIHYGDVWPRNSFSGTPFDLPTSTFHNDFHAFAVEWEPGEIRWYVDGIHYATKTEWFSSGGPFPAPFDVDFHLLLNLAVGGNLPGSPDSTTPFPQELIVDWVRVYQSALAKGTHASISSLLYDKAVRMKKIDAELTMPFENQARKKDRPQDQRQVSCLVRAQGKKRALSPKGALELELRGSRSGAVWTSRSLGAPLDQGRAVFAANAVKALVDEANRQGASIDRLVVGFDGAGSKKVIRTELDCWQQPS